MTCPYCSPHLSPGYWFNVHEVLGVALLKVERGRFGLYVDCNGSPWSIDRIPGCWVGPIIKPPCPEWN